MEIILIVAMARNRVIGQKNKIPWHIPEEMHHFKTTTMGHAVIMGRKTFESMGKALPGRFNVVLTRTPDLHFPGCKTARNFEEGLRCCQGMEKVFIIGGRTIYQESMATADTILLSVLDAEYEGDTFFLPSRKHFSVRFPKIESASSIRSRFLSISERAKDDQHGSSCPHCSLRAS